MLLRKPSLPICIFLLILSSILGKSYSQIAKPQSIYSHFLSSLDAIQSLKLIDDDSLASVKIKKEESFLQSGDTSSAFTEYIHWLPYTIRRNRISKICSGFRPYLTYPN